MRSTCIITDNSAQFTSPGFHNNQGLIILPHKISYSPDRSIPQGELKVADFPPHISSKFMPRIEPPSEEEVFICLERNLAIYDDIFMILLSKEISPLFNRAEKISNTLHGHANLHLIDSQNTSLGLGLIVQCANELINKQLSPLEIEKSLRLIIPHVYTLLCTPNLSYLQTAGLLDAGQAVIGEMLSLSPLFLIEEGVLNPLQKVKNHRSAVDYFIEFVDEFEKLKHVSVVQTSHSGITELRILHQHIDECYSSCSYSEYLLNPFLASMIGPRGFGIVVMEDI
jgi:DegV family protein with EDD domain